MAATMLCGIRISAFMKTGCENNRDMLDKWIFDSGFALKMISLKTSLSQKTTLAVIFKTNL